MNKQTHQSHQRIKAKKVLHAAVMEHGEGWRNLNLWECNFRQEFLKSWEKHLNGEEQDEFLLLAK